MTTDKYQVDMCTGPLFSKIVGFALPLMLAHLLQLAFNAADMLIVCEFANYRASAAIGCSASWNALMINLIIGMSVGANVLISRLYGAKEHDKVRRAVQTSMTVAIFGGLLTMVVGLVLTRPLLVLMNTPDDILDASCRYTWICFAGIPFITLYNFSSAILRSVGDTRRPFYYLVIAGVVNVLLNLVMVIGFHLDVVGVAIATATSHLVSAALVLRVLIRSREIYRFEPRQLRWEREMIAEIAKIGLPAGVQSCCFSISNMLIQSTINSFGTKAIAGTAICQCIEAVVYTGVSSYNPTATSFVAQNLGGNRLDRIRRSVCYCILLAAASAFTLGYLIFVLQKPIFAFFTRDAEVLEFISIRLKYLCIWYFTAGAMESLGGALRGLGYSILSTTSCLFGACVFRIFWVMILFPLHPTFGFLNFSYPVSWVLIGIFDAIAFEIIFRRIKSGTGRRHSPWSSYRVWIIRGYRYLVNPK